MSSFGEDLKRERELRQITLREISEATKISLRYLDALERNDFTHLPGGVFNKGFVRAYAQFIGVDPEVTVNAYLLEERVQESPGARTERPRERAAAAVLGWRVLSVLLLLIFVGAVAGLVVLWLRHNRTGVPVSPEPGGVTSLRTERVSRRA